MGKLLEARLEPWLTEDLARYIDAVGKPYQAVLELAREEGEQGKAGWEPSWGKLLNPATCPAKYLPYLGQFVGVTAQTTATEASLREEIKTDPGFNRGTLAAVEYAVRSNLTGSKGFTIRERTAVNGTEDAYRFQILIYNAGDMPSQAAVEQAVMEAKPGGVFFNIVVGGLTYAVLEAAHPKYSESEAAHKKYSDMESEPTK
jgi:hypothetical protein